MNMINEFKEFWNELEGPLKVLYLMIILSIFGVVSMLIYSTQGLILLIVAAFFGVMKLVDWWAKS